MYLQLISTKHTTHYSIHLLLQKNKQYELVQVKYDTERVRIKIIKENDVLNWPGVKSGYLNENDAIEMFNKYFV